MENTTPLNPNQNPHPDRKAHRILQLLFVITALILLTLIVLVNTNKKDKTPEEAGLTDEQKAQIIKKINEMASEEITPLSSKEKQTIIDQLDKQSSEPTTPLTDEEKQAILENIQN